MYVGTTGYVTTYDPATRQAIRDLRVGTKANTAIVVTPDGSHAYVTNYDGNVYVLDLKANTVTATIPIAPQMYAAAITPDGSKVFVSSWGTKGIWTISTANNAVTQPVGDFGITWYSDLLVSPDGRLVYAAAGKVGVFGVDGTFVRAIDLGTKVEPEDMSLSPGGDRLYIATDVDTVVVVTTITGAVTGTFAMNGAYRVAATADGSALYVASYDDSVVVQMDPNSGAVMARLTTGKNPTSVMLIEPRKTMWVGATSEIRTFSLPLTTPQTAAGSAPSAPQLPTAWGMSGGARVSWLTGTNWSTSGSVTVTVTARPGGRTCTATYPNTSCLVRGLAKGKRYTFTLSPRGTAGVGASASASAKTLKPKEKPKPKPKPKPAAQPPVYTPPPAPVVKPPQTLS